MVTLLFLECKQLFLSEKALAQVLVTGGVFALPFLGEGDKMKQGMELKLVQLGEAGPSCCGRLSMGPYIPQGKDSSRLIDEALLIKGRWHVPVPALTVGGSVHVPPRSPF